MRPGATRPGAAFILGYNTTIRREIRTTKCTEERQEKCFFVK